METVAVFGICFKQQESDFVSTSFITLLKDEEMIIRDVLGVDYCCLAVDASDGISIIEQSSIHLLFVIVVWICMLVNEL